MLIRPVRASDHDEILGLAKKAGIGMLSLPPDSEVLARKIKSSIRSFAGDPARPNEETFLFVIEDTKKKMLVGTTGITAHVGLSSPFYSYKLSTIVQAHKTLDIYSLQQVLHMVNDYTGASEVGSLFLLPDYRKDGLGRFASRCRFLMMAEFPQIFADTVIAEIRGVNDDEGNAPFYDHLARHFFKLTFAQADYLCATKGNQCITDLMPKYPIYVNLLPEEAQSVIGKPLPASEPAMRLLMREGFTYEGYIDAFDAGPTLQADRSKIRAITESRRGIIADIRDEVDAGENYMVSTTEFATFSMCRDRLKLHGDETVSITKSTAEKLQLGKGDALRYTPA